MCLDCGIIWICDKQFKRTNTNIEIRYAGDPRLQQEAGLIEQQTRKRYGMLVWTDQTQILEEDKENERCNEIET